MSNNDRTLGTASEFRDKKSVQSVKSSVNIRFACHTISFFLVATLAFRFDSVFTRKRVLERAKSRSDSKCSSNRLLVPEGMFTHYSQFRKERSRKNVHIRQRRAYHISSFCRSYIGASFCTISSIPCLPNL